jgi:hypothetical protein
MKHGTLILRTKKCKAVSDQQQITHRPGMQNNGGDIMTRIIPSCFIIISLVFTVFLPAKQPPSADDLVACVKKNDEAGLKKMLEAGADPDQLDSKGMTPLIYSVYRHNVRMATALIAGKADTNAKDSLGMTALHAAAFEGNAELVKLLLENGSDIGSNDLSGHKPVDYAIAGDHDDIVSMLARQKKQDKKIITNADLADLKNSDNMVISSFSGSSAHSEDSLSAKIAPNSKKEIKKSDDEPQNSAQQSDKKILIGVVGSGDVLNIDCEQGVPKLLLFVSETGAEAEAFVSSQKEIQFMQRNKTTVDAVVPGADGITAERKTVDLVSPSNDLSTDYQWHVWLNSVHKERRDAVPCLKTGIAVMGLTGFVSVYAESER